MRKNDNKNNKKLNNQCDSCNMEVSNELGLDNNFNNCNDNSCNNNSFNNCNDNSKNNRNNNNNKNKR